MKTWFEEVENNLPGSVKGALRRVAGHETYSIDKEEKQAEKRYIDYLVELGLIEQIGAKGPIRTYRIIARALKEAIKQEHEADEKSKLLGLVPFTPQKLHSIGYIALMLSLFTMLALVILSQQPLWGVLWLLLPFAYSVYGLRQLKISSE